MGEEGREGERKEGRKVGGWEGKPGRKEGGNSSGKSREN